MNTTVEATAVAPTGTDKAISAVQTVFGAVHCGLTALADVVMYGEAHIVHKISKGEITIQQSVDARTAQTNIRLDKFRVKLSGYKAVVEE